MRGQKVTGYDDSLKNLAQKQFFIKTPFNIVTMS